MTQTRRLGFVEFTDDLYVVRVQRRYGSHRLRHWLALTDSVYSRAAARWDALIRRHEILGLARPKTQGVVVTLEDAACTTADQTLGLLRLYHLPFQGHPQCAHVLALTGREYHQAMDRYDNLAWRRSQRDPMQPRIPRKYWVGQRWRGDGGGTALPRREAKP